MGLAIEIEDMAHEAKDLRSLVLATYEAIYNGNASYKEFDGALHIAFCMAHDHMKHMDALVEEMDGGMCGVTGNEKLA